MLKGHAKIELTDVNTKAVEVVESDNMFTNAVKEFLTPYCGNYSSLISQDYTDGTDASYKSLISGLLLFDSEIPENVNTFFPPSTAKMVGCANDHTSSSVGDVFRGTYNATESEFDKDGKTLKLVYDFSTSQANGTISSICLTNRNGGFGCYGNNKSYSEYFFKLKSGIYREPLHITNALRRSAMVRPSSFGSDSEYMLAIDLKNQVQYRINFVDDTHIKIIKRELPFRTVSLIDNSDNLVEETTVTLPNEIETATIAYNYDDGKINIVSSENAWIEPSQTVTVTQIGLASPHTVTQHTVTNTTGVELELVEANEISVFGGFVYAKSRTGNIVHRIEVTNSANHQELGDVEDSYSQPAMRINGRVFFGFYNSTSHFYIYDEASETLTRSPLSTFSGSPSSFRWLCVHPDISNPMYNLILPSNTSDYAVILAVQDYLATINNISPIVKTADQTMKITYTIQEVEDE